MKNSDINYILVRRQTFFYSDINIKVTMKLDYNELDYNDRTRYNEHSYNELDYNKYSVIANIFYSQILVFKSILL